MCSGHVCPVPALHIRSPAAACFHETRASDRERDYRRRLRKRKRPTGRSGAVGKSKDGSSGSLTTTQRNQTAEPSEQHPASRRERYRRDGRNLDVVRGTL